MKRFSAMLLAFGMLASFSANATECQFLSLEGDISINDIGVPFTGSSEDGLIIPSGTAIFEESGRDTLFFSGQPGNEESFFFAIANPSDVTILHSGAPNDSTGTLFQLTSLGNFTQIASADDSFNSGLRFRFEESLTPGIYCVQTAAFNNNEAKPWNGSLEITVDTQGIAVDTSIPACTIQAGAFDAGATRFADDFDAIFAEGKTVSNTIVSGTNIRLAPGSIEFAATTPPLNFIIQQVGQTTQTIVPSGDSTPLSQAGEYCIYLERTTADRLENDFISGSFSYTPTNDLYLNLLTTPSGTIDVAENLGTLQLPLSLANEQSVDTLVFVNLVVSEADANLDFSTSIFDTVVSIPAGSTSIELPVDIVNDTVIESDEQIRVSFRIPSSEDDLTNFVNNSDSDFGYFGINYASSELVLSTATITIRDDDTPSQENRTPSISIASVPTATVGQLIQFGVQGSDLDNDTLIYSYSGDASNWLSINESSGTLSGTPPTAGTFDNETVTVTDTSGASANVTFTVVVNPASVTPTITTTTNNGSGGGGGGCSITAGAGDPMFAWLLFAGIAGVYRRRQKA